MQSTVSGIEKPVASTYGPLSTNSPMTLAYLGFQVGGTEIFGGVRRRGYGNKRDSIKNKDSRAIFRMDVGFRM